MANDLYFIPIIERALGAAEPRQALREAFTEIGELGKKAEYQDGYRQFQEFMKEVTRHGLRSSKDEPAGEFADIFLDNSGDTTAFDFVLERAGSVVGTLPFPAASGRRTLRGIGPGHHVLSLHGSRIIWEADLREKDVIWQAAFPGRDFPAAAETGQSPGAPTREEPILGGEAIIRVYPGMRSGILEIEVRGKGGA